MVEIQHDGKTYVTLDALEQRTGYDREYLRKMAKSGKVDALRLGSAWLINPQDLERYRSERKSRGPHTT